jgi:hypothetical protein
MADGVPTFETFTPFGFVADWTFLFCLVHTTKIPILLGIGALGTTLLDSLTDGVKCGTGESEASLSLGASHLG